MIGAATFEEVAGALVGLDENCKFPVLRLNSVVLAILGITC